MKKILIAFLLISGSAGAAVDSSVSKAQLAIDFVNAHKMQKVGDGVCSTLVDKAVMYAVKLDTSASMLLDIMGLYWSLVVKNDELGDSLFHKYICKKLKKEIKTDEIYDIIWEMYRKDNKVIREKYTHDSFKVLYYQAMSTFDKIDPANAQNIKAGDIIIYDRVRKNEWAGEVNHIGFVYTVYKDGTIDVIEQNTGSKLKDSKVMVRTEDFEHSAGTYSFYRLR